MKLHRLISSIHSTEMPPDREIGAITENAQRSTPDSIFVCIKGAMADGHDFAPEAYRRGCRVFVAEHPLALPQDATVILVENARLALANLACEFYDHPSRKMHLIGITGTKGKTTTAQLIAQILNTADIPCGYIGTNGISYHQKNIRTNNTTPDSITLQATLSNMLTEEIRVAVVEVSSQALMQYRVDGTQFESVIFTNLSPDHIGPREHRDFDHYLSCKKRLFSDFGASNLIYHADDPQARRITEHTTAKKIISCAREQSYAKIQAKNLQISQEPNRLGVTFDLVSQGDLTLPCFLPLLGTFNASNALLALATAIEIFEIQPQIALKALESARIAGRSELIQLPLGTAVIDYAHNAISLSSLLSTLRQYRPARLIVLFGSVGERSRMRRHELGEVASRLADLAILTSDNPDGEDPNAIISEIASAFEGTKTPYLTIPNREEAIQTAVSMLRENDVLVLAGKGHENYQLINGKKIPFCEREILERAANGVSILG